jgi:hypothetical protein
LCYRREDFPSTLKDQAIALFEMPFGEVMQECYDHVVGQHSHCSIADSNLKSMSVKHQPLLQRIVRLIVS